MTEPPVRRLPLPNGGFITSLREDIFRRAIAAAGASLRASRLYGYQPDASLGGPSEPPQRVPNMRSSVQPSDDLLKAKAALADDMARELRLYRGFIVQFGKGGEHSRLFAPLAAYDALLAKDEDAQL